MDRGDKQSERFSPEILQRNNFRITSVKLNSRLAPLSWTNCSILLHTLLPGEVKKGWHRALGIKTSGSFLFRHISKLFMACCPEKATGKQFFDRVIRMLTEILTTKSKEFRATKSRGASRKHTCHACHLCDVLGIFSTNPVTTIVATTNARIARTFKAKNPPIPLGAPVETMLCAYFRRTRRHIQHEVATGSCVEAYFQYGHRATTLQTR
ncbi:hypothetical protein H109_04550 [Trichophyton interdigitale MR816]|uniref:Uncharacterized protein n=1 Tax=Trichophyton interdigitale (strain MR816) TaxID=1215338 RepID=A0A059J7T1_TRIIM|nr:hypothetical protein H101_02804 [Trichophyton interdigitale H6]KDB23547.1 hypothetical protein H109_04550 [Trichophyton interdigitale MR816]